MCFLSPAAHVLLCLPSHRFSSFGSGVVIVLCAPPSWNKSARNDVLCGMKGWREEGRRSDLWSGKSVGGGTSCWLGVGCCGLSNGGSGENTGSSAGMLWSIPWCSGAVRNPGHCFGSPGAGQSAGGEEGGTTQGYLRSFSYLFCLLQFVFG